MTNEDYIRANREEDVRRLALRTVPDGVNRQWCLQQIEGWQVARQKLPRWAETEGLWYPPRLSMEQCSGELTALYKHDVVERLIPEETRRAMADLTGGLGVDFSYVAPLFRHAAYVEVQPHLVELARHNMPLLLSSAMGKLCLHYDIIQGNGDFSFLEARNESHTPEDGIFSLLYLDPARRDGTGRKTVAIADCTPNFLEMQDELFVRSRYIMLKLSPMLDIHQALYELKHVCEVHVVSVKGECKELLFVCSAREKIQSEVTFHCVNLGTTDEAVESTGGKLSACSIASGINASLFLYEPNASVLKAGIQDILCALYPVQKLHPQSNLFVSEAYIPNFPGRRFRVMGHSDFGKQNLKELIGDLRQANLTTRNFPVPVVTLRRQLRLSEGGSVYLFATTLATGKHVLVRCEKA